MVAVVGGNERGRGWRGLSTYAQVHDCWEYLRKRAETTNFHFGWNAAIYSHNTKQSRGSRATTLSLTELTDERRTSSTAQQPVSLDDNNRSLLDWMSAKLSIRLACRVKPWISGFITNAIINIKVFMLCLSSLCVFLTNQLQEFPPAVVLWYVHSSGLQNKVWACWFGSVVEQESLKSTGARCKMC